jgi:xylan 1,4-beta-xylosidase
VTWAFEFEGQPYFEGFRDLASNGIDKPVLNVFRMLGRMAGDVVTAESSGAVPLNAMLETGVRERPDVGALATRQPRAISILAWNYHDDDRPAEATPVKLVVAGLPGASAVAEHYRIDAEHSNAYEAWKRVGSPQALTPAEYARLEKAGQLARMAPPAPVKVTNGEVHMEFALPRQAVSLITLAWDSR